MNIIPTKFSDVLLVEPTVFGDDRGFFYESYSEKVYKVNGIELNFVQDNHSLSQTPGTIRGMHYQLSPKAQTKLVRATRGAIYDVVVDIRKGSPTYGEWEGFILTADNKRQLLVPQGFAHGFCTLERTLKCNIKWIKSILKSMIEALVGMILRLVLNGRYHIQFYQKRIKTTQH